MANTQKVTTTKGSLEWVNITGEGKENLSGKMKYNASIALPKAHPIFAEIKAFWEANKPAGFKKDAKSTGVYPHMVATDKKDEDGKTVYEEAADTLVLRFSTDTTYPDGKPKEITIYNAKGNKVKLPEGVMIGNGTIGCISGAMGIYETKKGSTIIDAGVTLYLNAIQIIKLEEYSSDAGFEAHDEEDGGWTGDQGWEGEAESSTPPAGGTPRL